MNQKITFPELVELMARKQQCSKRDAENFMRELITLMTNVISEGETLKINSLGVFKPVWVEARSSVNVQTGEPYVIPGHYKLTFTPVKQVREAVNEPFSCFVVEVLPDDAPILATDGEIVDEIAENETSDDVGTVEDEQTTPVADDGVSGGDAPLPAPSSEAELSENVDEMEHSVQQTHTVEPPQELSELHPDTDERSSEVLKQEEEESNVNEVNEPVDEAEEETPDEEEQDEKIAGSYRRGLWTGIAVATTICLSVALLFYLFIMPHGSNDYMKEEPIAIVADTTQTEIVERDSLPVQPVADTIHTVVHQPETIPVVAVEELSTVRTDTIRSGVFLTNISLRHYGHKAFWVYIYEENKAIISNPDLIPIGTVVVIPSPQKYGINPNDTASVGKALHIANELKSRRKQ